VLTINIRVTVIVQKEDNWYVAKCLENSIASQGSTIEESLDNLREALELFYEDTTPEQKEPEFKEKYKNRSCQEWKNGEMKNFHGLDRARGYGLRGMSTQAKLTAIAVNLKRIAGILSSKLDSFLFFFRFKLVF
jgi:predicted RNase H-like HicB family nuclease